MKISLNWLKEYVKLPAGLRPEQLAHDLTMCTVEVEGIEHLNEKFEQMLVGKIEALKPHPKADRLRLAELDLGAGRRETLVCGGTNLREGMLVAVALPGAVVRVHGEGEPVALKPAEIRGVRSAGMILSSAEVGLKDLFPAGSDTEIIDLSAWDETPPVPGTPLARALHLADAILSIDNKSLTNRPDLWGHYGLARELAAIYDAPLAPLPEAALPAEKKDLLQVAIADPKRCRRYIGVVIDGCLPAKAPAWMQARLFAVEQRPIDLLVDLTNYVMFAVGQPMHVFDYGRLAGGKIVVRPAAQGERMLLLDGKELELDERSLVIADAERPVALAGVMGGERSGVAAESRRIVLESACFKAIDIRRTAARLGVRTQSSMRFEKGIDAARTKAATDLFLHLLKTLQPQVALTAAADCFPGRPAPVQVAVSREFITARIGKELSADRIAEKLVRLGFAVAVKGDVFQIGVPSWRATGDVSIAEDIVEEVARLEGYDNLEFVPPRVELRDPVLQPQFDLVRSLREYLAFSAGMQELITYPWIEDRLLEAAGFKREDCVRLFAPPAQSTACVRPSLVPAMLFAIERNMRRFPEFAVFETGRVFRPGAAEALSGKGESLPFQPRLAAGAVVAADRKRAWLRAKGILGGLFSALSTESLRFAAEKIGPAWAAADGVLGILVGAERVGLVGLLAAGAARKAGLEKTAAAIFELDLEKLCAVKTTVRKYQPIPVYPVVEYDLALLFDSQLPWSEVEAAALGADPLIRRAAFVDEYRGQQVPEGKKSVALRLELCDPNATLTAEQVEACVQKLLGILKGSLGGELRLA